MRIRRVDQDASFPINPFEGIGDAYPSGRKNNDVEFKELQSFERVISTFAIFNVMVLEF